MNLRKHFLAVIGIGAFVICVLACRPSFSPDGKKVVFPVFDAKSKQTTIMLYDRETKRLERIFTRPSQNDVVYASAVWTPDGKHVVVATVEGEKAGDKSKGPFLVAVLPVDRKAPTRILHVPENPGPAGLFHPPPIIGKHMFLGGKAGITRLDLETGEMKTETLTREDTSQTNEVVLFGEGERLYYCRDKQEGTEIGEINPDTFKSRAILDLKSEDGDFNMPSLAVSKDGARIAVAVRKKEDYSIRIYREGVLERTLTVGTTNERMVLGNLLWSRDEKLIYAAHFKHAGEGRTEYGLCEIPLNERQIRRTPLYVKKGSDSALFSFQIALSPDGKWIAATTEFGGVQDRAIDVENPALYLVDLTRAKRPVTKIPVSRLKSAKIGANKVEVLDQDARAVHKIRIRNKPLEEWLEMLELEGSDEEEQAVKILRENAAKVVPLLIRMLEGKNSASEQKQDDDGSVELDRDGFVKTPDMLRERAMKALPRIGSAAKAAIPVLIRALADDFSMDAEHAISSFGTNAALPLIEALTNRHERIRQTASSLLGSLDLESLPEAVPELIRLLDHADAEIRKAALTGLSRIGRQLQMVIPVLVRRLTDGDIDVRSQAASVLGDAGASATTAVPDLTRLLSDQNLYCRASAADALGKIGEKAAESLPNLIKTLEDQDGFVRVRAASAVWKITRQKNAAMPVLKAALKESEHSVRWNAAVELGEIEPGNQDAIEALIRMLSDDPEFINVTAMALGKMGPNAKAALPALRETLEKLRAKATPRNQLRTQDRTMDGMSVQSAIRQIDSK